MDFADVDDYRWLRRGARRKRVLVYMLEQPGPVTGTQVAKSLKIEIGSASKTLRELRWRGLVVLLNSDAPFDRKYAISTRGSRLLGELRMSNLRARLRKE